MDTKPIYAHGMHGLGDNIVIRAAVKRWLAQGFTVYLDTPWPCVFADLMEGGKLFLIDKRSKLRTQAKNATRERDRFFRGAMPATYHDITIRYPGSLVRSEGTMARAMFKAIGLQGDADFSLPARDGWPARARRWIGEPTKPVMIFRPLTVRAEWANPRRNPDQTAWETFFNVIRDRFFVVSIADIVPAHEWAAGRPLDADVRFHHGELDCEDVMAVMAAASLVYCAPGFATVMAQAIGTPVVTIFGGYQNGATLDMGVGRYHFIDPIRSCNCFAHSHPCDKKIDIGAQLPKLQEFVGSLFVTRDS